MFRNTTSPTAALFVLLCAIFAHADDNPSNGASNIPVGDEPTAIGTADFNGDGKPDLAVVNRSSNTVSILLGDGAGGFAATPTPPALPEPHAMTVDDINGDGKADLVVLHGISRNVTVLLGSGTGSFGPPLTVSSIGESPSTVAAGDFNNDGKRDLVIPDGGFNSGGLRVLIGRGDGTFNPPATFQAGVRPSHVAVGDFNEDGKSDLAVANVGFNFDQVSLLLGDGAGAFGPPTNFAVGKTPARLAAVDFNNDGNLDLAVTNTDSHNVSILLGNGAGNFGAAVNYPAGSSFPSSVVVGDFDNDGRIDLGVGFNDSFFKVVSILLGDGAGGFGRRATFTTGSGPTYIAPADFNLDGITDLASANAQSDDVSILLSPPPTLTVADATVVEGNSGAREARFNFTLSAASDKQVEATYTVTAGTAAPGSDYDGVIGTGRLMIPAGSTTATVSVNVFGDTTFEPDETFFLDLSFPLNAFLARERAQATITNDDPLPAISIADASVFEGSTGTRNVNFSVTLSNPSSQTITVSYATADGTATAGSDYTATSGTLTFTPGLVSRTFAVTIISDAAAEPDETFTVKLSSPTNAAVGRGQAVATIRDDDTFPEGIQFTTASLQVGEAGGRATLTVTRGGGAPGAATVDYTTVDSDTFTVGCADAAGAQGSAFARCDFATAVGRLFFAAGETMKTISVPIIDDGHGEGPEAFQVRLSNVTGTTPAPNSVVTVTIVDNDSAGATNPVLGPPYDFFVRQQYLDFLSREPDAAGLNAWLGVLNNCQPSAHTGPEIPSGCDRIFVSGEGFFRSVEFQLKAAYAFHFYKAAFNRLPEYTEIVSDMSFVAGATQQEVFERKALFALRFTERQEFIDTYGAATNAPQFVNALMDRYGLQQITTPDPNNPDGAAKVTLTRADLINGLTSLALTRSRVLRAVADSDEVVAREFNNTFVAMQYYGYLRRKPEPSGYEAWLRVLQSGDTRTMVNGFLNSAEYKLRFGNP